MEQNTVFNVGKEWVAMLGELTQGRAQAIFEDVCYGAANWGKDINFLLFKSKEDVLHDFRFCLEYTNQ